MKITTIVTGILAPLIFSNVQCMLYTTPNDTAAKVGDLVTMRCSSSYVSDPCGHITWKHFKMDSETGVYVTNVGKLIPAVTSYISLMDSSTGNCDLRITAMKSAAGRYQCLDQTPNEANAQLIVLENDPEVEIIIKSRSNNIALRCSVNYNGNWAPKVQWVKIAGDRRTTVTVNESETSKSPVSSLIQMPLATFDLTGATEYFVCNVTISQPGGSNEPIYTWQSQKNDTTLEIQVSSNGCGIGIHIGLVFLILFTSVRNSALVLSYKASEE